VSQPPVGEGDAGVGGGVSGASGAGRVSGAGAASGAGGEPEYVHAEPGAVIPPPPGGDDEPTRVAFEASTTASLGHYSASASGRTPMEALSSLPRAARLGVIGLVVAVGVIFCTAVGIIIAAFTGVFSLAP